MPLQPMEARSVASLPEGEAWRYEPKWDGFRCLAQKEAGNVSLRSKSGKPLGRYFPDIVDILETLPAERFLLDGELLIAQDRRFSFSALQMRLHPAASRVAKLAQEQPAQFMLFDLLEDARGLLLDAPLIQRRTRLEAFHKRHGHARLPLSPQTASLTEAKGWSAQMAGKIDGIMAKQANDLYRPGERQMQKFKFYRSADCVVGGFRYGSKSDQVGSLLLGLYDEAGLLHHVGFTSSIARAEKAALTAQLEALVTPPGFTGDAPGAPSRWSNARSAQWQPLKPELVVEVCYDHVSERRFRHGTKLLRWRPDKAPSQCTFEQLEQPVILPL